MKQSPRRSRDASDPEIIAPPSGHPLWLLILVPVLCLVVGFGAGLGVGVAVTRQPDQAAKPAGDLARVPYEQFRQAVLNKTEAEVVAAVGRPSFTSERGGVSNKPEWTYASRVLDPVSQDTIFAVRIEWDGTPPRVTKVSR